MCIHKILCESMRTNVCGLFLWFLKTGRLSTYSQSLSRLIYTNYNAIHAFRTLLTEDLHELTCQTLFSLFPVPPFAKKLNFSRVSFNCVFHLWSHSLNCTYHNVHDCDTNSANFGKILNVLYTVPWCCRCHRRRHRHCYCRRCRYYCCIHALAIIFAN